MNTIQLLKALRGDEYTRRLGGVYPADKLPIVNKYPFILIANTDNHDGPGKHWVAIYLDENKKGEFFDSFGQSPSVYGPYFENFLMENSIDFTSNLRTLQSMMSAVCGQYCLFFLIHRCRDFSLNKILSVFTEEPYINDEMVHNFVEERYDIHVPVSNFDFMCRQICTKRQRIEK